MKAVVGKKIGMTRVFEESGKAVPVTLIDTSSSVVAKKFTDAFGFNHVEFGFGKKKEKRQLKPDLGNKKDLGFVPKKTFVARIENDFDTYEVGNMSLEIFSEGMTVDVSGVTKGKGFQGVMKRHGFKGGKRTHGQSDRMRAPGSIGTGTTPGRVVKGKKMAGRMGRDNKTIKNLKIFKIDLDSKLVAIKGAVPGATGSYVFIKEVRR